MSASPFSLEGKSVLITGAAGGIGSAMVDAFRAAGADVTGADRDGAALQPLTLAHRLVFDLTDSKATAETISAHMTANGVPDILVSNAGFTRAETLEDVNADVFASELSINLTGAFAIADPVMRAMAERGSGSIIFVSSVNALGHFGNPAYSAAKAGLIAYARSIALERGARGVRANVICPGSVRTPAWDHRLEKNPELLGKVLPHYPLGRLVTPQEVANTAVFLGSDAASGITGTVLAVDAGLTSGNLVFVNDVIRGGN